MEYQNKRGVSSLPLAYHFDRDDIALKGHFDWFKKQSDEERAHAQMFMEYQNKRGGRIVFQDIKAPAVEWTSGVNALEDALALERKVNEALLVVHTVASENNDSHLCECIGGCSCIGEESERSTSCSS